MMRDEAFEKVVGIIGPFAKNSEAMKNATAETGILTDLGVNSARLIDIILAFEDEFGIAVEDEAADKIRTLGDAVDVILEKTATA